VSTSQQIPDEHPSSRRGLAFFVKTLLWGLAAFLVILVPSCVISFSPTLKRQIYGPDHLASVTLEPERVAISVELTSNNPIGKAEYERRLTVTAPDGSSETANLTQDHGGFASANLYRTKDGKFVLADTFDSELISLTPLRITHYSENYLGNRDKEMFGQTDLRNKPFRRENRQHLGELLESNYFNGLFYVGAFRFQETRAADGRRSGMWSFAPASEQEEFIRDPGG
jgi:hypothetical protein